MCPYFISANHERVGQQAHNYNHLHMQFYQRVPFPFLPGIRPSLALSACLLSVNRFLRPLCLTASHPGCPQRSGGADLQQSAHPQMLSPMEAAHWRVLPSGGQQPGQMPGCLHSPRRQDLENCRCLPSHCWGGNGMPRLRLPALLCCLKEQMEFNACVLSINAQYEEGNGSDSCWCQQSGIHTMYTEHIRAPSATRPCRTVHNAAGNCVCSCRNVTSLEWRAIWNCVGYCGGPACHCLAIPLCFVEFQRATSKFVSRAVCC